MDLHDAVRGLRDVELERVEDLVRAEPHVPAAAGLQGGPEHVRVPGADHRVGAVGRDHQVVALAKFPGVRGQRGEVHGHPELRAALLEDLQQPLPAHRGEAVPAAGVHLAAEVHVDVVPAGELALHRRVDAAVGVLDAAERLVREHDAEAERVVGRVPLPDGDLAGGVQLPGEGGEVQPARAAADDCYAHPAARLSRPWPGGRLPAGPVLAGPVLAGPVLAGAARSAGPCRLSCGGARSRS